VYNALLTGRPYFLEMIEDVEIVARFARARLRAGALVVRPRGEAGALAQAAAEALPDLTVADADAFRWSEVVERLRERWPIQYLLPDGASVR
jgi:hypothetical protein